MTQINNATSPVERLREQLRVAPLHTSRLCLRPVRATDAESIYHGYAPDHEVARWMGWKPHDSITTTEALVSGWIANWETGKGALAFAIERAHDAQFLGIIDLDIGAHGGLIGYVLCRHAWGVGFATEAARRIVDLAFEHFGVWRVWATCATHHSASRRVLEKSGMQHEGVLRRWIVSPLVSPEPRDSDCMSIIRDDWVGQAGP